MITPGVIELFEDLERGAAAVTSTRRLARQVHQRYAEWKSAHGASAWPTPRVYAYEDWLLELWRSSLGHHPCAPLLLSDDQELLLWEQIIRRHPAGGDVRHLLQLSGTARAARRTWVRVHDWCLDWDELRRAGGSDTRAFMRWADSFRERLDGRRWITTGQLPGYLVEHSELWPRRERAAVWWLGFEVLSPARDRVMKRLAERAGPQRGFSNAGADEPDAALVPCGTAAEQWTRIARWARQKMVSEPGVNLGVVCPDLRGRREEIEETLEDVLHPELYWRPDAPRVFHLSLGRPLSEYPMVAAALDLLRWSARQVPFEVISRTLRSPYVAGGDHELAARAAFELEIREWQQETISPGYLLRRAGERGDLTAFTGALARAVDIDVPARADPATWAEWFSNWLGAFVWPGNHTPDSHEFQTQSAWREQLSRFATLGAVQRQFTRSEALKRLAAMADARILQFHDDRAPLQIMGVAEAAGLWFDEVWLADMSDAVWPPPPQPDPFIPVPLQKQRGMPGASAQSALAQARHQTRNLLAGAFRVRVSFAAGDGDARTTPSPLFASLPTAGDGGSGGYPGRCRQLLSSGLPLESVPDHRAPPLPEGVMQGGVSLIADQARCPFRAAAHYRLEARALREVEPGLNAAARGILVHAAVRDIWERIGDWYALDAMVDDALRDTVAGSVDRALARHFADSAFQARFLAVERRRLMDLLMEWLSLERNRPPFRVAAAEVEMQVEIGGGGFRVRADRIDELEGGRLLIIDYKTGLLPAIREWVDPRMEEPQLPMYALGTGEGVAALALAGIRRGECELRGVGNGDEGISLKPVNALGFDNMSALAAWWRDALGKLSAAYQEGDARVEPKSRQTCQGCDATAMCRIFEQRASVDD